MILRQDGERKDEADLDPNRDLSEEAEAKVEILKVNFFFPHLFSQGKKILKEEQL